MRRTLFAAAIALISLAGCKKDDEVIDTIPDTGAILFINTSTDKYQFYLDDQNFGSLFGGDSARLTGITTGAHRVKAVHIDPPMPDPTLRQQVVYVRKDSTEIFAFP